MSACTEAALTHPSWEARASAALVAALTARLIDGARPDRALEEALAVLETKDRPDKRVRETLQPLDDYEHAPGGWTVYTTRLALRCLLDARGFRSGVEAAVRLGGDADTNAAVAGALLGAWYGVGGIPASWLRDLERKEVLLALI